MRAIVTAPLARLGLGAVVAAIVATAGCGSKQNAAVGFDAGPPTSGVGDEVDASRTSDAGSFCAGDCDGDGYSTTDCNDYDPNINPEAYDFVGDGVDSDCDGTADNPVEACETIPNQAPGAPIDFARAVDLCAQRAKTTTGAPFDPVVRAEWGQVKGLGPAQRIWISQTKDQQVGIVSSFGQNATRRGKTMIGLSTGPWGAPDPRASAALDDPNFHLNDACADIPLAGTDCASLSNGAAGGGVSVQDWAELTLWLKVPRNAGSMDIDFSFFSTEFNQFWNASLNDAFFVLVTNKSLSNANVAKDAHGLAVTVNSGFFQLCPSPAPAGLSQDKAAALQQCVGVNGSAAQGVLGSIGGTAYDGASSAVPTANDTVTSASSNLYVYGGGSGWLTTSFPVTPGEEMQIRIVVMDTFDGLKDSAVLVDAIRWEPGTTTGGVNRPPIK